MLFSKKSSIEDMQLKATYTNHVSKMEQKEMDRCFARLFSSEDGKKVLAWIQVITFHRVAGAGTTDDELRYREGQRALVANILRMIDRGKTQ